MPSERNHTVCLHEYTASLETEDRLVAARDWGKDGGE